MKNAIVGFLLATTVLMSMAAVKSPYGPRELASLQDEWLSMGETAQSITVAQTALGVTARTAASVNLLAATKTAIFDVATRSNASEFRFQTTADADAHVVNMYVARGRTDHYDLAAVLTLTGGTQTADSSRVFVDTIAATETFIKDGKVVHSGADSIARYIIDLYGYSRVLFIATTLEGSSTLVVEQAGV